MKEKTEIIKSENKIEQTLENEEYESKLTYQEKDGEIIYKVEMKEKTADIDILEEYLDKQDRKYVSEYRLMILNAIETLISENKELKEENNVLKQEKEYLECIVDSDKDNYIPKSKVVEELRKAINNEIDTSKAMFEGDFTNGYIYALQSLLGKE